MLRSDAVAKLKWHDPEKGKRDFPSWSEEALTIVARNNESFARFGWDPYMHNPKLIRRLHRIAVPTMLIWGASDGFVSPAYGEAYRKLIPNARLDVIAEAGHYPHVEQPDAFARSLRRFIES
jgi:pimeloyl-ACP methyl ester carboxylesterase